MSNLRKIQEIQRLTKDIEFNQKYLYGNNDGQTSAFFLDPDQQDWGNRNEIFEQYVEDLEKKIERRDRLRNELSHAKSSMRNVNIFDRKLPKDVLQHMGPFVTAPKSSYRNTAASLRSTRGRGRSRSLRQTRTRTHKKKHRRQK